MQAAGRLVTARKQNVEATTKSCTPRDNAGEAGRDISDFSFGLFIFTAVHEDNDTAVKFAVDRLSRQYSQDFSKLVQRYGLAGDPAACQARLREYIDAGASTIFLSAACPDDYLDANLQLIAKEVIPAFRG